MFRNYLAAALRNLVRNKLYAAINIIGLAVGFAAALLIALFVRDEYSYDTWIPGHENAYLITYELLVPGSAPLYSDRTRSEWLAQLKLEFPKLENIARLNGATASLRHGDIEANEKIYWADADFFSIVRLPAIAGDPAAALQSPGGVVLTRAIARKYFGRDDPIGDLIEIDRMHPMRVMAVLEDLPSNTQFDITVVASGRAPFSGLAYLDSHGPMPLPVYTYLKLAAGSSLAEAQANMSAFLDRLDRGRISPGFIINSLVVPLADVHFSVNTQDAMRPHSRPATVYVMASIGGLIVLIACINFVNLVMARAARRGIEIGVRKVSGAQRRDLIIQFLGESAIYALFGLALAMIMTRVGLPNFNAFLQRAISMDLERNPALVVELVLGVLGVGVVAGAYPAFVLSGLRPAGILKGGAVRSNKSSRIRRSLVTLQFAILIGLVLATATVYRQVRYALNEGMRLNADQVLIIATDCATALKDEIRKLPGVRGAACSTPNALNFARFSTVTIALDGTEHQFDRAPVDFGFFELYDLHPVAGRFFSQGHASDVAPADIAAPFAAPLVVNETAVRRLGFPSGQAAIGKTISYMGRNGIMSRCEIIGVVADFAVDTIHAVINPTVYFADPAQAKYMSVKIAGHDIPETLDAIDVLWKNVGEPKPINRFFLNDRLQALYLDISRQANLFTCFSMVAVFIACLGLFGLAAFTAEHRTKEVGVRKALGASRSDILRLLLWEFAKPVLWANVIAWPIAYVAMRRWLEGFAYHIDMEPWMFVVASALALGIAVLTVVGHALMVARSQPVTALRYE